MAVVLGIDTGGTYTDAVLVEETQPVAVVHGFAKAPTTHHDLSVGLRQAVESVLAKVDASVASAIGGVSVSTTLATNALVEGQGDPAAVIAIGFSDKDLERSGLSGAVDRELVVTLDGGHDAHGFERCLLDADEVRRHAERLSNSVGAFAVAAQFSVRNPAHELAAAEVIRSCTGRPVTMSHELSAKLDGPRRALTAALNARLLATIERLNSAVEGVLASLGIDVPLMVVRGDGSLVSTQFVAQRPIETILSGPAASVVGALHLAGLERGLVVDIGGTTTDVAMVTDGRPAVTDRGAVVGGYRTMVEAVDMATVGLGGDSAVTIDSREPTRPLRLGPQRAIPIGRLAFDYPSINNELDRQLAGSIVRTADGRFLVSVAPEDSRVADDREADVLERLADGPLVEGAACPTGLDARAALRLQNRGLVRVATLTPTDASVALADSDDAAVPVEIDRDASVKVAELLARRTVARGAPLAEDGPALCRMIVDELVRLSAEFALAVAIESDGVSAQGAQALIDASLRGHVGAARIDLGLAGPMVAIGAPAEVYYDRVAALLGSSAIVPAHASVANAVGAAVGQVRVRRSATITQPTRGQFKVHLDDQPAFGSVERARDAAMARLESMVMIDAELAGAATPELTTEWTERTAMVNDKEVFVEGTLHIEAAGRPKF